MNYQEDPFAQARNSQQPSSHPLQTKLREQDDHLHSLHASLHAVHAQTNLLHSELAQHHDLLANLDHRLDESESRFGRAATRLRHLYAELTDRKFTWTASALIFLLFILLLVLIAV